MRVLQASVSTFVKPNNSKDDKDELRSCRSFTSSCKLRWKHDEAGQWIYARPIQHTRPDCMKFVLKSACKIQPSERLAEATMGNLSTKRLDKCPVAGVLCLVMSGEVGLCIKVKFIEYVKKFIF